MCITRSFEYERSIRDLLFICRRLLTHTHHASRGHLLDKRPIFDGGGGGAFIESFTVVQTPSYDDCSSPKLKRRLEFGPQQGLQIY